MIEQIPCLTKDGGQGPATPNEAPDPTEPAVVPCTYTEDCRRLTTKLENEGGRLFLVISSIVGGVAAGRGWWWPQHWGGEVGKEKTWEIGVEECIDSTVSRASFCDASESSAPATRWLE